MILALSRLTIDSIDLAQASVSGTFSSSTALIPAKIIPRSHIDDAERDIRGKRCAPSRSRRHQAGGCPLQEFPARNLEKCHQNVSADQGALMPAQHLTAMCKARAIRRQVPMGFRV